MDEEAPASATHSTPIRTPWHPLVPPALLEQFRASAKAERAAAKGGTTSAGAPAAAGAPKTSGAGDAPKVNVMCARSKKAKVQFTTTSVEEKMAGLALDLHMLGANGVLVQGVVDGGTAARLFLKDPMEDDDEDAPEEDLEPVF